MTNQEFSNEFDTLVNSYRRFKDFDDREILDSIEFNEYEKSVFLTQAQEEVVINLYNGKNPYGDSFESTEELRRYLEGLVKTKKYNESEKKDSITDIDKISNTSVFYTLPTDIAFITYEQVVFKDDTLGCYNGSIADVYPITQDEYNRVRRNPFRGPTKYRVLRIDTGDNNVELISKYTIDTYLIKYLSKPSPIILEDLPNNLKIEGEFKETPCKLNGVLHYTILRRAVQMALTSKSINAKDDGKE